MKMIMFHYIFDRSTVGGAFYYIIGSYYIIWTWLHYLVLQARKLPVSSDTINSHSYSKDVLLSQMSGNTTVQNSRLMTIASDWFLPSPQKLVLTKWLAVGHRRVLLFGHCWPRSTWKRIQIHFALMRKSTNEKECFKCWWDQLLGNQPRRVKFKLLRFRSFLSFYLWTELR